MTKRNHLVVMLKIFIGMSVLAQGNGSQLYYGFLSDDAVSKSDVSAGQKFPC